jgi:hypothetical protein
MTCRSCDLLTFEASEDAQQLTVHFSVAGDFPTAVDPIKRYDRYRVDIDLDLDGEPDWELLLDDANGPIELSIVNAGTGAVLSEGGFLGAFKSNGVDVSIGVAISAISLSSPRSIGLEVVASTRFYDSDGTSTDFYDEIPGPSFPVPDSKWILVSPR